MPPTTRAQAAAAKDPLALFAPLLAGDGQRALELLPGEGAAGLSHTGPSGLTTLHAAVASRCGVDVLTALVAACAPLEGRLEQYRIGCELSAFLEEIGSSLPYRCVIAGSTVLFAAAV
jgi:hypothetical protein